MCKNPDMWASRRERNASAKVSLPRWMKERSWQSWQQEFWPSATTHFEFDWARSTHEVYHDPETNESDSDFAAARMKLDKSYHLTPTKARQDLQDAILKRILESSPAASLKRNIRRPWLVFTAGPMGVGKGYVLDSLHRKGLFPLEQYVHIDPDKLKAELPETAGYLRVDPEGAASKVHRESTQMSDILLEYALEKRLPAIVDGSLRDVNYYSKLVHRIRHDFPEYRLAILHVTADPATIRARAKARGFKTGRMVPSDLLERSIVEVPASVQILSSLVDKTFTIRNEDGNTVELVPNQPFEAATSLGNDLWASFRETMQFPS